MSERGDLKGLDSLKKISRHLPVRQRLVMEYGEKLSPLLKKYPRISLSVDDPTLATNLADTFRKIGFEIEPEPSKKAGMLIDAVAGWLKKGHLVAIHYRPRPGAIGIIQLFREIKKRLPYTSFKGLVPIFVGSVTTKKQVEIFRILGEFGIRHAAFLSVGASPEQNLEEMLKDLDTFRGVVLEEDEEGRNKAPSPDSKTGRYGELLALAEKQMASEDYEKAIETLSEAIKNTPDFRLYMVRGDAFFHAKNYPAALADYREANRLEKSVPDPYAKIGSCCFVLVRDAAGKGDRGHAEKYFSLGFRNLEEAEKLTDEIMRKYGGYPEKRPTVPYSHIAAALGVGDFRELGMNEVVERMDEMASRILAKTVELDFLDPSMDVDARIDHAILLARYGHYEKAERIFREVTEENVGNAAPAFNNFAVELRKNGEYQRAFEIYLELLRYDIPDREIVMENLKTAGRRHAAKLREEFRLEDAAGIYKRILMLNPRGKEWVLCDLALTYLERQEQAQASSRFMEAIYINPKLMESEKFGEYTDLVSLRAEMLKKLHECMPGEKIR